MSINFCSINATRIDGFCGTQRAKVLARLIHEAGHDEVIVVPPKPTPRPHSGGTTIGGNFNFRPNVQPPTFRPDIDQNLPPVEQPYITVTADILGMRGSETIEATSRIDFVVVTDLEINAGSDTSVNISNTEI